MTGDATTRSLFFPCGSAQRLRSRSVGRLPTYLAIHQTGESMAVRDLSPTIAVATTTAGNIYLSPSMLVVMPIDQAWLGIRELHFASIGDGGYPYVTDAGKMLPDEARTRYSSAVTGVLGQLAAISPQGADNMLGSLSSFADLNSGFDGLEGISMSAMLSASRLGDPTPAMQYNQWLMAGLGAPAKSGGGYASSPVLDAATGALGLPSTSTVTQGWQNDTQVTVGQAITFLEGLAATGLTLGLEALGVPPGTARDVANGVVATADGVAVGATIGSFLGPGGTVVGGIIGGLVGLASDIFGHSSSSASSTPAQPAGAASQTMDGQFQAIAAALVAAAIAEGSKAVVQGDVKVEKDGGPLVVNSDGGTQPAPPDSQRKPAPAPDGPSSREPPVITPSPDSCPVGDDDTITGFRVQFWGPDPILLGSAVPIGPGVDALTTTTGLPDGGTAIQIAALPSLDETGVLVSGGATLGSIEGELRQVERTRHGLGIPGRDPWGGLEARLHGAHARHTAAVEPAQLVQALRVHGFTPEDSISSVLRSLNRRYGP